MSRIGKMPVTLPKDVTVNVSGGEVAVKGPKGQLSATLPPGIGAEVADGELRLLRPGDSKQDRAYHGLARALANNMVTGVSEGFRKSLEIQGVGYRADVRGNSLNISVGYSNPVEMPVPKGLSVSMEGNTTIHIDGIDKELVGQFAADVRSVRPPEPYKGKGIRYLGEHVRRKVGKTGAA